MIEAFGLFQDWLQKYEYIIDRGKRLDPLPEEKRTKENLVSGCLSRLWVDLEYTNGRVIIKADSDATIAKGIASLLIHLYSNREPEEIINGELYVFKETELDIHLSNNRSNGLNSMIEKIVDFAKECKDEKDV